ncbi:MAG: class I SAM-dependent methyltransferase, partial [Pseudomonadota bacterium]
DDLSLENEAERMGARAIQSNLSPGLTAGNNLQPLRDSNVIQRRVVNPAEIKSNVDPADTDTAEIEGVRETLIDILTRLHAVKKDETEKLFSPKISSAAEIEPAVSVMDRAALVTLTTSLQTAFPTLEFNTSLFDVTAVGSGAKSSAKDYWKAVKKKAIQWLLDAKGDDNKIQEVFGDGTVGSKESKDAAKKAKPKYQKAADALALRRGDTVVEIGCGTGLNFPLLQDAVGPKGKIVGVDLTDAMLDQAKARVDQAGWRNVELVHCEAAEYRFPKGVNGIVSTFALTLMPEYDRIIEQGSKALAPAGRFVVLDLKMPPNWPLWLVRFAVWLTKPFGVALELSERHPWESIRRHLREVAYEEYYLGAIFLSAGEAVEHDS